MDGFTQPTTSLRSLFDRCISQYLGAENVLVSTREVSFRQYLHQIDLEIQSPKSSRDSPKDTEFGVSPCKVCERLRIGAHVDSLGSGNK